MKFFVDTADVKEIRELAATGLLDGVTTNPTLIAKSGRDFIEVIKEISGVVSGPVSAEVTALDAEGMIAEGTTLNAHSSSKICTNTNQVGDHVTATLDGAVSGSNGASIPAGATINLTVTQLKRSENSRDNVVMEFAVNSVTFGGHTYPIEGSITSADVEKIRDEPKSKDIQKVGIGAAAGGGHEPQLLREQGPPRAGEGRAEKTGLHPAGAL